ncbi:MAG: ABC transporter substrate-binding protein [Alphaproteobacteria bacterium]|nr:ABC transporter substrate-binding protein [Alphaproteobacteria bacterium]
MRRRDLLLAAVAWPAAAVAGPVRAAGHRIGWISQESREVIAPFLAAFKAGLSANGLADIGPIDVIERFADGDAAAVGGYVAELQRLGVRLIVAQGAATPPVVRARPSVPVVFGYSGDPVVAGIVQSLARPGGNASGVTHMAVELMPKRIDFVRSVVPDCRKIALLSNARHAGEEGEIVACQQAVAGQGIALSVHRFAAAAEAGTTLSGALDSGAEAVIALSSATMVQLAPRLAASCLERRVPLVSGWADIARAGALLTYGPNLSEAYKSVARYVVRVLGGASPADLPIEQPTVFELVVNLKTANALGLRLPATLLAQADEVIE